jgi:signal peptidase I
MTQFYDNSPEHPGSEPGGSAGLPPGSSYRTAPPSSYPRRRALPFGAPAHRSVRHDLYTLSEAPPSAQPHAHESATDRIGSFLREMLQIALPAIVLAVVVHLFLAQATVVFGQSMEPNLSPHQRLIVDKLSYRLNSPQRNDIVVIDMPSMDDMLVKRVVGLPGERIEIRDGIVLVNGGPVAEPFPHDLGHTSMAPIVLRPLEYFVMGDNRDNSNDSRFIGFIERRSIVGKAVAVAFSLDRKNYFAPRFDRFFEGLR